MSNEIAIDQFPFPSTLEYGNLWVANSVFADITSRQTPVTLRLSMATVRKVTSYVCKLHAWLDIYFTTHHIQILVSLLLVKKKVVSHSSNMQMRWCHWPLRSQNRRNALWPWQISSFLTPFAHIQYMHFSIRISRHFLVEIPVCLR